MVGGLLSLSLSLCCHDRCRGPGGCTTLRVFDMMQMFSGDEKVVWLSIRFMWYRVSFDVPRSAMELDRALGE